MTQGWWTRLNHVRSKSTAMRKSVISERIVKWMRNVKCFCFFF